MHLKNSQLLKVVHFDNYLLSKVYFSLPLSDHPEKIYSIATKEIAHKGRIYRSYMLQDHTEELVFLQKEIRTKKELAHELGNAFYAISLQAKLFNQ